MHPSGELARHRAPRPPALTHSCPHCTRAVFTMCNKKYESGFAMLGVCVAARGVVNTPIQYSFACGIAIAHTHDKHITHIIRH